MKNVRHIIASLVLPLSAAAILALAAGLEIVLYRLGLHMNSTFEAAPYMLARNSGPFVLAIFLLALVWAASRHVHNNRVAGLLISLLGLSVALHHRLLALTGVQIGLGPGLRNALSGSYLHLTSAFIAVLGLYLLVRGDGARS